MRTLKSPKAAWTTTMNSSPRPGDSTEPGQVSILLIDDDVELCDLLSEYLLDQNMDVQVAHDGRTGLNRALNGRYDLVLLDVMMPGMDGFEVLRLVRRQSGVPVIMMTARLAKVDRLSGLDNGADDYVPKPFDPDELLARARAVLRRTVWKPRSDDVLEHEGMTLVPTAREVWCEGVAMPVTTIEYDILELLVRAAGRIVTRDELTLALYRRRASPFDRAIDVHVCRMRRKLGAHGNGIRTVRGVGYLYRSGPSIENFQ
jgi:two-component system response regulator CpxR